MAVLATDSFTRADAANLGASWTQAKGTSGRISVVSNQGAAGTALSRCGDYYNAAVWPNDQYSQVTLVAPAGGTYDSGVMVRSITTGTTRNFYFGGCAKANSNDLIPRIYKYVGSAFTSLGSGTGNLVAGDVVRLQASGTTITLYVNGVLKVTVTDSSLASGSAGIYEDGAALSTALFDDWEGGNLSGSTPVTKSFGLVAVG